MVLCVIISDSNSELLKKIEFKNQHRASITYMELSGNDKTAIDTENTSFENVSINGHDGTVVMKNSLVTVIWTMNDHIFMVRGQTDKNTAIKIAEGVKYIE